MGRRKKHGRATKKNQNIPATAAEEQYKNAPHSFIFHRGHVGKNVKQLILDFRRVMEPYTASNLKVRKKNVLKDFVSIAGALHVSHFVTFTKTEATTNMRIMRLPRGPTMTFRVHNFSLVKDIVSSLKRPNMEAKQFLHHPLLVMNNFSGDGMHFKLMASMFQNMFPSINVNKVSLKEIKRCFLVNYNDKDETIDLRHYNIKAVPVGMSRGVKKLTKSKIPNLGKFEDFTDFLQRGGEMSESEAEMDGPDNIVVLPQNLPGQGNVASSKSAIRLTEIGPRLQLQLIKIEEGICSGEVLFHSYIHKTEEELEALKALREKKRSLKAQRKKQQEDNIKKKQDQKQEMKTKSMKGMKKLEEKKNEKEEEASASDADDDVEYFKEAVGENPDPELFQGSNKPRKRKFVGRSPVGRSPVPPSKKKKFSDKDKQGRPGKNFQEKPFKGTKNNAGTLKKNSNFQKGKNFKERKGKTVTKQPGRGRNQKRNRRR